MPVTKNRFSEPIISMAINENESRYRCCCGACRAKIGAIWVAGFEGLVALTFLIFGIVCQNRTGEDTRYCRIASPIFYVLAVISVIFVVVLALGLVFKKVSNRATSTEVFVKLVS